MKCKVLCLLTTLLLLTACAQEEPAPPPPVVPPLHTQADSVEWDGKTITAITPVSAFETEGSTLKIFPYFDSEHYISIERIYVSNNGFWESVKSTYQGTPNAMETKSLSLFTTSAGVTLGCVAINDEECYIVRTETLSSAYVEKVCEILCQ